LIFLGIIKNSLVFIPSVLNGYIFFKVLMDVINFYYFKEN